MVAGPVSELPFYSRAQNKGQDFVVGDSVVVGDVLFSPLFLLGERHSHRFGKLCFEVWIKCRKELLATRDLRIPFDVGQREARQLRKYNHLPYSDHFTSLIFFLFGSLLTSGLGRLPPRLQCQCKLTSIRGRRALVDTNTMVGEHLDQPVTSNHAHDPRTCTLTEFNPINEPGVAQPSDPIDGNGLWLRLPMEVSEWLLDFSVRPGQVKIS